MFCRIPPCSVAFAMRQEIITAFAMLWGIANPPIKIRRIATAPEQRA